MRLKLRGRQLALITSFMLVGASCSQSQELMDDFEQLLPRGAISAITSPEFVSADKAKIDGDAWILGFVIDGQARAYSLTLLNSHEVVNDASESGSFAAVW